MIKVIDKTHKLRGTKKPDEFFDKTAIANEMLGDLIKRIKKGLTSIYTNEDVIVTLMGSLDKIEFSSNASPDLIKQIRNVIKRG